MAKHKAYRNLNRRDGVFFSVAFGGRVQSHERFVWLADAKMKHATAEQTASVRSGPRKVCAWILGDLVSVEPADLPIDLDQMRRLACDPKKVDGFTDAETGQRVDTAAHVVLTSEGAFYAT